MRMESSVATLTAVGSLAAAKYLFSYYASKGESSNELPNLPQVATVSSLQVFPIKSCQGLFVNKIEVTESGGVRDAASGIVDRSWVVVDPNGGFVSALRAPQMFQVNCSVEGAELLVDFSDMPTLRLPLRPNILGAKLLDARVWNRTIKAMDCGDKAAAWFHKVTRVEGVRLVHASPDFIVYNPRVDAKSVKHKLAFNQERIAFQDLAPVNLLSEESIADVNSRLSRPISNAIMRANILVNGCAPYEEDGWRNLEIGEAKMYFVKLGTRCKRAIIDVVKGEFDETNEVLNTLNSYRYDAEYERPALSIDLGVVKEGQVRVGDHVFASSTGDV